MFKCRECGNYFNKEKRLVDWVEAWGHMEPMYSYVCPFCGGEDYAEDWEVEDEENIDEGYEDEDEEYD